ncbi:hypothetical protein FGO68_gene9070 [Halteria grandinella]|uniref:Uncharacterized protein n=1 Tax=Halteria grandinella TaxID=5974 RepID=A0A8J8T258_HALGN|nr:hypothetical protein FGO68_gene9070 [Halteria grandinella]
MRAPSGGVSQDFKNGNPSSNLGRFDANTSKIYQDDKQEVIRQKLHAGQKCVNFMASTVGDYAPWLKGKGMDKRF